MSSMSFTDDSLKKARLKTSTRGLAALDVVACMLCPNEHRRGGTSEQRPNFGGAFEFV